MKKIKETLALLFCNKVVKKIIFLLSLTIGILCLVAIFTLLPKENNHLRKQIKDLQSKSEDLSKAQAKYDSTIKSQEAYVIQLEAKIGNIKEKTVIVKEYYTKIQERVTTYDHNQIDSFFRQKYNY